MSQDTEPRSAAHGARAGGNGPPAADLVGPRPGVLNDWRGTAALQEDVANGPQLEALAGLDRNEWIVVGVTIEPVYRGDERAGQVYCTRSTRALSTLQARTANSSR